MFNAVGARTLWLGEAGTGSRAKVMVNTWVIGVVAALAETLSLGRALELDPALLFEILDGGPLDLPYARIKGAMMTAGSFDDVSFSLSLARKDAQLASAVANDAGIELPALEGALARMLEAERRGHGDEDMAATYRVSEPDAVSGSRPRLTRPWRLRAPRSTPAGGAPRGAAAVTPASARSRSVRRSRLE